MDKEANGKELNEGCSSTKKSFTVTVETAEQSELLLDCEVEVAEADSSKQWKDFCADDEHVCLETCSSDASGENVMHCTLLDIPQNRTTEMDNLACPRTSICYGMICQDQNENVILESGHEALNRNESITSSVSDTLSSADSVYENETHHKRQDTLERVPEQEHASEIKSYPKQEPDPEQEQYSKPDGNLEPEQYLELEQNLETEQYLDLEDNHEVGHYLEPEQDPDLQLYSGSEQDPDLQLYPEPEQDPDLQLYHEPAQDLDRQLYHEPEQDLDPQLYREPEQKPDLVLYPEPEHDPDLQLYSEPEQDPDLQLSPLTEQDPDLQLYPELEPETEDTQFDPGEPGVTEESILEHCIREEAMSDVSNESCHTLDPDEMDECLRVEIAAVSSDSDTDEKWRAIFSSSINKEDDDSYLDSLQLSAKELFVHKTEVPDFEEQDKHFKEVSFEVPQMDALEQSDSIISFPAPTQEDKCVSIQSWTKISEDESENGINANHKYTTHQQHKSKDKNKKLPNDFCVIQETKSENVSTEHVDFQLACKQWRKMEEQTKNKIVLPTMRQTSLNSSHSFMYTPVRKIERTHKNAKTLVNLNLVGYCPHAQFSPCSEDSGLDDLSYRSPYDDPETLIEREFHTTLSIEGEENFRRERGLPRMGTSMDCAPSRGIPRSISTPLTPSFIITSSPTKEPLKQDVSANNIVILDPRNDFTSSSRHGQDMATWSGEQKSDDNRSNLIILETSNLIIRSASEFSLNKGHEQPEEKMFVNNPFFKLRSRSTISLVDEEIKLVKQREEELRKDRANLYDKESFNSQRMLPNHMETLEFDTSADVAVKCKSSPSSPMKSTYRVDRSTLSCENRFPEVYTGGRRKSAMALRWEAGEFTKND